MSSVVQNAGILVLLALAVVGMIALGWAVGQLLREHERLERIRQLELAGAEGITELDLVSQDIVEEMLTEMHLHHLEDELGGYR